MTHSKKPYGAFVFALSPEQWKAVSETMTTDEYFEENPDFYEAIFGKKREDVKESGRAQASAVSKRSLRSSAAVERKLALDVEAEVGAQASAGEDLVEDEGDALRQSGVVPVALLKKWLATSADFGDWEMDEVLDKIMSFGENGFRWQLLNLLVWWNETRDDVEKRDSIPLDVFKLPLESSSGQNTTINCKKKKKKKEKKKQVRSTKKMHCSEDASSAQSNGCVNSVGSSAKEGSSSDESDSSGDEADVGVGYFSRRAHVNLNDPIQTELLKGKVEIRYTRRDSWYAFLKYCGKHPGCSESYVKAVDVPHTGDCKVFCLALLLHGPFSRMFLSSDEGEKPKDAVVDAYVGFLRRFLASKLGQREFELLRLKENINHSFYVKCADLKHARRDLATTRTPIKTKGILWGWFLPPPRLTPPLGLFPGGVEGREMAKKWPMYRLWPR